ncbi:zinc ribbon domain-containing protein [Pyrococcus sp. NA2]|nr:zinc ribbon domain-containing protein [Pyrococcus sp. NA2]
MFRCPRCGFVADRDYNASINIAKKGLEELEKRAFLPAQKGKASSPRRR